MSPADLPVYLPPACTRTLNMCFGGVALDGGLKGGVGIFPGGYFQLLYLAYYRRTACWVCGLGGVEVVGGAAGCTAEPGLSGQTTELLL